MGESKRPQMQSQPEPFASPQSQDADDDSGSLDLEKGLSEELAGAFTGEKAVAYYNCIYRGYIRNYLP